MKKIIFMFFCFLETVFFIGFSINVDAKSNFFFEDPDDNVGSFSLTNDSVGEENKFNIVTCKSNIEDLLKNQSIIYAMNDIAEDGWTTLTFKYLVECSVPNNVVTYLKCVLTYDKGSLSYLKVFIETSLKNYDMIMFSMRILNGVPSVELSFDCDFADLYKYYDSYFWTIYSGFESSTKYNSVKYKECYKNFDLSFVYAMMYNPIVDGKAVTNIISDYDNPLLLEEIVSKIHVSDDSCTPQLKFLYGDYGEEGYYELGDYDATYIAIDDCGNVSRLLLNITVKDIRGPIVSADEMSYSYTELIDTKVLENKFTITDSNGVKETTFDFSDYTDNYNVVGEHNITVTSIDNYDNERVYTATINVIDDVSPIITIPKNINSSCSKELSIEDIRSKIKVSDTIDGEITDFILIDNDNYASKAKGYSKYSFTVRASDKSGNTTAIDFVVKYNDAEFPEFDLSDLLFVLPNNEVIFKKDIEELLIDLGYSTQNDIVSINSDYFNNYYVDGNYPLDISINNVKYCSEIIVSGGKVSIGEIDLIDDEINYMPLIIGGVSISILVMVSLMGIVIYKKRH